MEGPSTNQALFTCLSCSIAFLSAEEQRVHYRSDHHRYNMKRRVASLPPVSASIFDQKVLEARPKLSERKAESAITATVKTIDKKISAARARLSIHDCLFCTHQSRAIEDNLIHMSIVHSFFIPDAEYLVDLSGLISYLGEKIAVGNVCLFCNEKSREYRSLQAVRQHMLDKSHCKLAYESSEDRLEISDFYDFTSSYPSDKPRANHKGGRHEQDWEDIEDGDDQEDVDEVIDDYPSNGCDTALDTDESIPNSQLTYGDSPFELILPSGARIGHRSLQRYYMQSLSGPPHDSKGDPNSGAAIVRRLLADRNSALVPRKGGFGAFGSGTDVVRARNRGEAREAGKHIRQFRDQKRREDFKTKVGFIANSQKHFRDPLLQ